MCRVWGLNPRPSATIGEGRNAPTNRPDSYEGLRRRPQFYPLQGGALIRNVFLPGRGSIFHGRSIAWGSIPIDWRPPTVLPRRVCRLGTLPVGLLPRSFFVTSGVRTPAGVLPRRVPLPSGLLGHRRVQPRPPPPTLDIIVDPCRFDFSPIF